MSSEKTMTRRDRFAMAAMPALITSSNEDYNAGKRGDEYPTIDEWVSDAYRIADAMEQARKVDTPEEAETLETFTATITWPPKQAAKPDTATEKLAEAVDELFQAANHVRLNWDLPWSEWPDARGRLREALEAYRKEAGR